VHPNELPDGWTQITTLPVGIPTGAVVEAVGDAIVVAAPDATWIVRPDGTFQRAEAPPLAIPPECCGSVHGLPAGDALVFAEEGSTQAWIFDLTDLRWTRLNDRPNEGFVLGSALLDGRLVVVDAAPRTGEAISRVAELDLDSLAWTERGPVPVAISVGGVSTRDGRLIVAGTRQGPNNTIIGPAQPAVLEFTAGGEWEQLPSPPISGQAAAVVPLRGRQLLAFNYDLEAAVADFSGTWTSVAEVPMPPAECYPRASHSPNGVVALCGGIAWWDPTTASWTPIETPQESRIVALSDSLVALQPTSRDVTTVLRQDLPPS
jgi:hypothetical protein